MCGCGFEHTSDICYHVRKNYAKKMQFEQNKTKHPWKIKANIVLLFFFFSFRRQDDPICKVKFQKMLQ